jgi:predicted RNase H-like HicB family nuclease
MPIPETYNIDHKMTINPITMAKPGPFTLSLDAILVRDRNFNGFTAYFKQFPNIVAEGEDQDRAMENLFNALHDYLKYESVTAPKECGEEVIEKSFSLESN